MTHSKKILTICVTIIFILYGYGFSKIDRYALFSGDSLVKLIQAKGLIESNFQSQNLFYPGKKYDKNYNNFPFKEGATASLHDQDLNSKGIYIGAFPYLFSLISTKIMILFGDIKYLSFINAFFGIAALIFIQVYWKINYYTLFFILLCTNFFILSFEYSEILIFSSIHFIGYSMFLKQYSGSKKGILYLFSGLICGISIFFRLEAILFFVSILIIHTWRFSFIFIKGIINSKDNILQTIKESPSIKEELNQLGKIVYHSIGFGIVLILFIIFNYINYNNFIGPRFAANEDGFIGDLALKVNNIFTLLFFLNGKMGLFCYTPIMLILMFYSFNAEGNYQVKYISMFIVLVSILTPSDGFANWGPRFFSLTIFPFALIFDNFLNNKYSKLPRFGKILCCLLLLYSSFITYFGFKILVNSSKQFISIQSNLLKDYADIWIFDSLQLAHYSGQFYFKKIIFLPKDIDSLDKSLNELYSQEIDRSKKIIFFKAIIPDQYKDKVMYNNELAGLENYLNNKKLMMSKKNYPFFEAIVYVEK